MNASALRLILLVALCTLCCSCYKHKWEARYTFRNDAPAPVNFALYGSEDDYNTGRHSIVMKRLETGEQLPLSLEVLQDYWVDWYNDDYSLGNWVNRDIWEHMACTPLPKISIIDRDQTIPISTNRRDSTRSVLFPSNALSSDWEWEVTDIPAVAGKFSVQFRRDHTGTFIFAKAGGPTTTKAYYYNVLSESTTLSRSGNFQIVLFEPGDSTMGLAGVFSNYFHRDLGTFQLTGRDTLRFNVVDTTASPPGYYLQLHRH